LILVHLRDALTSTDVH